MTSTVSLVPRKCRVTIIRNENEKLPASAIRAGALQLAEVGRSAMITPMKPTITALQRRQPTFSRRNKAETAVT